jgi:site-specific DNA recombinase
MNQKATRMFRGRGKKTLFARLAFCHECGAGMVYKSDRKTYVCGSYQKRGTKACSSHTIKYSVLKEKVLNDIAFLADKALNMDKMMDFAQKYTSNERRNVKGELKELEKAIKQLEIDKDELVKYLIRKVIDEDTYKVQQEKFENELKILKKSKSELERTILVQTNEDESLLNIQATIQEFVKLKIKDNEKLRHALHNLIEKIEVSEDGNITIHYNFKNPLSMGA